MITYTNYTGRNTESHLVSVGQLDVYFSYTTVVAFRSPNSGLVVSENQWGPTTGRHLNEIDGGEQDDRLPRREFVAMLEKTLDEYGLL